MALGQDLRQCARFDGSGCDVFSSIAVRHASCKITASWIREIIGRVVFNRWKNSVREMRGEICCVQKVATTCAGNVRGILLCSKVAKHVCGKCAGRFGVFKGWQKNECWKCARKFVVTCDSVDELSDHEHLHIVAILAQDECCLIFVTSAALASSQVCRN